MAWIDASHNLIRVKNPEVEEPETPPAANDIGSRLVAHAERETGQRFDFGALVGRVA